MKLWNKHNKIAFYTLKRRYLVHTPDPISRFVVGNIKRLHIHLFPKAYNTPLFD